ncbi:FeoA family protein [Desulfovibrio sp. JC022]|uniref:FeoA family protein n=1 Tax=Desulfovibrio sp. JC022 TaxID=2593642 RepID=UPI001EF1CF23|nr:FeoA family protein [Desulfovibrio sp. JC022]
MPGRRDRHGHGHGKVCKCCTLMEVSSGKKVKIRCHHAKGAVRQRLLDLGFVPQTDIEVIRRAPLGDPIECRVANYKVALRKSEACLIEVEQY